MYTPQYFEIDEREKVLECIRENSFAILISQSEDGLETSHLPLFLDDAAEFVYGHMAHANPQWKSIQGTNARIVFHGPHAYVSPHDYATSDGLPTWNYTSVVVDGTMEILASDSAASKVLPTLVAHYEGLRESPWELDLCAPEMSKMIPGIVCFRMKISNIQPKFKLSQNKSLANRVQIAAQLREREGDWNRQIANLMLQETLDFSVIEKDGTSRVPITETCDSAEVVLEQTSKMYLTAGFEEPWTCYLALQGGRAIGTCGFKSPPIDGRVEIAYFSFPGHEGRGLASVMAKHLVRIAKSQEKKVRIAAQTLAERKASHRILEKLGFQHVGTFEDADDGAVWEWHLV